MFSLVVIPTLYRGNKYTPTAATDLSLARSSKEQEMMRRALEVSWWATAEEHVALFDWGPGDSDERGRDSCSEATVNLQAK